MINGIELNLTVTFRFSRDDALLVNLVLRLEGGLAPARVAIFHKGGFVRVPGEELGVLGRNSMDILNLGCKTGTEKYY